MGRSSSVSTRMANPTILPLTSDDPPAPTPRVPAQVDIPVPATPASFNFKAVLQRMIQQNASDVHLKVGRPPVLRVNGDLMSLELATAQAGRSEGARRADHDAEAGEGVRRGEGGRLRDRRSGHRALPRERVPAARHDRLRHARGAVPGEDGDRSSISPRSSKTSRCVRAVSCSSRA